MYNKKITVKDYCLDSLCCQIIEDNELEEQIKFNLKNLFDNYDVTYGDMPFFAKYDGKEFRSSIDFTYDLSEIVEELIKRDYKFIN
jgi:hypothetical protein